MSEVVLSEDYEDSKYWLYYREDDGKMVSRNVVTGEMRIRSIPHADKSKYELVTQNNERFWVPVLMDQDYIPGPRAKEYTSILAEEFCSYLVSGSGIMSACKMMGISYNCFARWRLLNEEFSLLVNQAFKDRALVLFERTLDIAENTIADRDEIALGKLKAEIYSKAAAIGDDRFNPKQRIEADHRIGVVSVETGIRRSIIEGEERDVSTGIEAGVTASISKKE